MRVGASFKVAVKYATANLLPPIGVGAAECIGGPNCQSGWGQI